MTQAHPLRFTQLSDYLASASDWVGHELMRRLPQQEPAEFLHTPARDYPQRGGKRFRPALLLLSAAMVGGSPQKALPSALALELFQNFALVHDDIEDGSLLRRGQPTLHRMIGTPLAINVGDYLFSEVFALLGENQTLLGAEAAWAVHGAFLNVFRETFQGQALDIGWAHTGHMPTRAEFTTMIEKKTGWYTGRGPCEIGAQIGGATPDLQAALGRFGQALGIGFQLKDDLLNLTEDSADVAPGAMKGGYGKERGGDVAEGKRTLITIELGERLSPTARTRLFDVLRLPPAQTTPEQIEWVIDQAIETGALAAVDAEAKRLGLLARQELEGFPESPQRAILEELTDYLIQSRKA